MHCHLWQPNKPDKTAISNKPISSWITKNNPIGTTIFLLCIASFFFLLCPPYKQRYNRCTSSAVWSKAASRLNLYDFVMIKFTICQRNRKVMKLLYVTVDGKILVFPTEYWAQLSMYVLHSSGCPRTSTLEKIRKIFNVWVASGWRMCDWILCKETRRKIHYRKIVSGTKSMKSIQKTSKTKHSFTTRKATINIHDLSPDPVQILNFWSTVYYRPYPIQIQEKSP